MFEERITAIGRRFLTDRSFTLIVAPAIADFQFDGSSGTRASAYLAVLRAVVGAACEDVTRDIGGALTFVALALIPACYYTFLVLLCLPPLPGVAVGPAVLGFAALSLFLSLATAAICYWPEPLPVPTPTETP
jgi:hypothetical protein